MKKTLIGLCIFSVFMASASAKVDVPLKRVVLFNSGVGYFEHAGTVTGNDHLNLRFRTDQMNDVLKSMVVLDESGGSISAATYDAQDPISRTLKSFSIDLTDNPSLDVLLNRLRGVKVELSVPSSEYTGRILGVEDRTLREDDVVTIEHILNLSTEDGLQRVRLEDLKHLRILDEKLDSDLQAALEVMANGLDTGGKNLKLEFRGKGKREISLGYILEMPVWKTSYRLVLDEKACLIQGWAHIENTTDRDFEHVSMSLVSGRPISFIQDLYQPLYVHRPVVKMDLYESIVPPEYEGAVMEDDEMEQEAFGGVGSDRESRLDTSRGMVVAAPMSMRSKGRQSGMLARDNFAAGRGGEAQAEGREAGELFEYVLSEPVTLPRQKSAMMPIVNKPIEAERLSIFNREVDAKHPLNGVRIENNTGLFLMRGPVTVFEEGLYAGDARLPDTAGKETRLLSYALDLATEVKVETPSTPEHIESIKAVKGVLTIQRKYVNRTMYKVVSKRERERTLLIEQAIRPDWKLVAPDKADETTADVYRFRLPLKAHGHAQLEIREERLVDEHIGLINMNDQQIVFYLKQEKLSPAMRKTLEALQSLQAEKAETSRARHLIQQRLKDIATDQDRLRRNMQSVGRNSENYTRYERKLGAQEDEIEQLDQEQAGLLKKQEQLEQKLTAFVMNLNVE